MRAVERARVGDAAPLFAELRQTLEALSRRIASQCDDDAFQEAQIAVWRAIDEVDLSRPATVRSYLVRAGIRAMYSAVRTHRRKGRAFGMGDGVNRVHAPPPPADPIEDYEFEGLLALYVHAVRTLGDTFCMHKLVGEWLRHRKPVMSAKYHRAVSIEREHCRKNGSIEE